jgi:hypothetical protein
LQSTVPHVADFQKFVFIVGAPRSGTTTMSRVLQLHPQVAFPFVKEPHFFAQHDLRGLPPADLRLRVERDYLDRFFAAPARAEIAGADGSVSYLYVPEQLEPVLDLWPDSRFIVGVRDPMALLPSLHQRLIYTGDENIVDFAAAWGAIPDRAKGRRIPRSCIEPRWLRYDEAGRYATYLERLYAAVGRDRCLVVVHDDLVSDPEGQHRRILEFAGLEPMAPVDLGARRVGQTVRYPWLQRLLKRPPKFLYPYLAGRQFKQRFATKDDAAAGGKHKVSLRKRLIRWNRIEDRQRPVPPAIQHEIRAHFKDEVDRLGVLIGRDLGHWLQPRGD